MRCMTIRWVMVLGGGGTSIPYFLQDRVKDPVGMENEYGRILLETGIPGLMIWLIFIFWTVAHTMPDGEWGLALRLTRNLLALTFATAVHRDGPFDLDTGNPTGIGLYGMDNDRVGEEARRQSRRATARVSSAAFATNRR